MADEKLNQDKPENLNQQGTNSGTTGNESTNYADTPAADWSTMGNTGADFASVGSNAYVYSLPAPENETSSNMEGDSTAATSSSATGNEGQTYQEETAAEIATPVREDVRGNNGGNGSQNGSQNAIDGKTWAYSALAVSILSLFVLPVALGILGIVLGFVARNKGATGAGTWAIALGAISLVIGMFVLPFY